MFDAEGQVKLRNRNLILRQFQLKCFPLTIHDIKAKLLVGCNCYLALFTGTMFPTRPINAIA